MRPVTILRRARKLLEKPERWTQGTWARNAAGAEAEIADARSFCPLGAMQRVDPKATGREAAKAFLQTAINNKINIWNDNPKRTHAEVLAAFDQAIAHGVRHMTTTNADRAKLVARLRSDNPARGDLLRAADLLEAFPDRLREAEEADRRAKWEARVTPSPAGSSREREALEAVNEWFGQREAGVVSTNTEATLFAKVNAALSADAGSSPEPSEALLREIAGALDHPSVFMGGPSRQNLRKAADVYRIVAAALAAGGAA